MIKQCGSFQVHCLDAMFCDVLKFSSMYVLINKDGEASLFDTGTPRHYYRLRNELSRIGVHKENLTKIFLSHVHMDHCGNSSLLLRDFPNSKIFAHPTAVVHLLNPETLIKQTKEVMPSDFDTEFGDNFQPIEKNRIEQTSDNMFIDFCGGAKLKVLHTPGHAFHHITLIEPDSKLALTGDAFGSRYEHIQPKSVFASTSPATFNPDKFLKSIDHIMNHDIKLVGLTHFGFHDDIGFQAEKTKQWIYRMKEIINNKEDISTAITNEFFDIFKSKMNKHWMNLRTDLIVNTKGVQMYYDYVNKD